MTARMRLATTAGRGPDKKTARLVTHFAVGNRTLCGVELAGAIVKAPDAAEPAVDCHSCAKRVPK